MLSSGVIAGLISGVFVLLAVLLFLRRALLVRFLLSIRYTSAAKLVLASLPARFSAYEACLPSLPVPALASSIAKYLESVRPLMSDPAFETHRREVVNASSGFQSLFASLQRQLWRESLFKRNWLNDWWLQYVYLQKRSPIAFYSNYYIVDRHDIEGQETRFWDPLVRCTAHLRVIQHLLLTQWRGEEKQKPFLPRAVVPYTTANYRMAFGVTRVPGQPDGIRVYSKSRHIVVLRHNETFAFDLLESSNGTPVKAEQLLANLRYLFALSAPDVPATPVAALTADDRSVWAESRRRWFATGLNRASLLAVESALFVVCLDDCSPQTNSEAAQSAFVGRGGDRWFDKSLNYIISANGRVALNCEHSTLDMHVPSHLMEALLQGEEANLPSIECQQRSKYEYHPRVKKIQWMITPGLAGTVTIARNSFLKAYNDSHLIVFEFFAYGKAFMRKMNANPNSWLQMCLQLAFYRLRGRFVLTYESCELRYFAEARTECIRPLSSESVAWCRLMCDPEGDDDDRLAALQAAMRVHQRRTREAERGRGYDRHLFGLFVLSLLQQKRAAQHVLSGMLSMPFDLSTTPLGGGFCASSKAGYGVGFLAKKDRVFFHIHSHGSNDSQAFAESIQQALLDVEGLFPAS